MGSLSAMSLPRDAVDQEGSLPLVAVNLAGAALLLAVDRLARAAALEVGKALGELVGQVREPGDRLPRLAQLVGEDLAHRLHGGGRGLPLAPHPEEHLDL